MSAFDLVEQRKKILISVVFEKFYIRLEDIEYTKVYEKWPLLLKSSKALVHISFVSVT